MLETTLDCSQSDCPTLPNEEGPCGNRFTIAAVLGRPGLDRRLFDSGHVPSKSRGQF